MTVNFIRQAKSLSVNYRRFLGCIYLVLLTVSYAYSQGAAPINNAEILSNMDSSSYYQSVRTYVNPVLPGDHPDPTLLKVGNDFYHCGSSFHFTPYLPIYHSTDLVHWEVISRVLPPSKADWVSDRPSQEYGRAPSPISTVHTGSIFLQTGNGSAGLIHLRAHGRIL